MIVVYAGRRAESMPAGSGPVVEDRARRLLNALAPSAVVGSAADGGDHIVLNAALKERTPPQAHVILPTEGAEFREASVSEEFRLGLDRILEAVPNCGGTVESLGLPAEDQSYAAANQRILDKAAELVKPGERVVALVIASPGDGTFVEDLVERAELSHIPVLRIDPAITPATRPQCFVAMPFGKKLDPQRRFELNCDLLYDKILVPALEDAQLGFRRADEQIDSGVVLQPMIEAIAEADIVIGDLATGNFNVGWELGLRHMLRARYTLLMLPAETDPPFDLSSIRHVSYAHDETGISDDAAIDAWGALQPYLEGVDSGAPGGNDSPVDAVMKVTRWARVQPRKAKDEAWEALRLRLALARDLDDGELMLEIVSESASLTGEQREMVAAEAGVGLIRLGSYEKGRELLAKAVANDPEIERAEAHAFLAQSIYRDPKATIAALGKAEGILKRVLVRRPDHPEIWALIGAINKRRAARRKSGSKSRADLIRAMGAYERDYRRDLNAFYEGINLVACGVVLKQRFGDAGAGDRALDMLPSVRLAAELAHQRQPTDFWAAVSVAEARLHDRLLGGKTKEAEVAAAYRTAGEVQPPRGSVMSSMDQLEWLLKLGVQSGCIKRGADALAHAAGFAA